MDITCFLIVQNGITHRSIKRTGHDPVACYGHQHMASIKLPDGLTADKESSWHLYQPSGIPSSDFPIKCDKCDYVFQEGNDYYVMSVSNLWVRADNGEFACDNVHSAPVGAMWRAEWMEDMKEYCGEDGQCLNVMTPGGVWCIDSHASNCTKPDDRIHKCWVRHGTPPLITVDKEGNTCAAGAGSIQRGNYHGFLRNGMLIDA